MELPFYRIVRPLIRTFLVVVYRPKYLGCEHIPCKGGVILAGTHTNNFDCLALMSATKRPIHFLGKHTLFKGMKRYLFRAMGVIPVDRTKSHNHEAMMKAVKVLKGKGVIGIFPEGTINRTGEAIMPFKMGAVKMACDSHVPIVPFAIRGEYRPFKKGLEIEFGEPLTVEDNLEQNNYELMYRVKSLLERK